MPGETTGFDLSRINQFILGKQHLTADTGTDNILSIARDIGGLHATGATTPYLSLLARTNTFDRKDLEEELYRKKTLTRIRYARNTFYILPKEMLPVALAAVRSKAQTLTEKYLDYLQLTPADYENLSQKIFDLLRKKGLAIGEIKDVLGPVANLPLILRLMCFQGFLICGKPKGGWKSNLHTYHLMSNYYPDINLDLYGEEDAQERIITSYIEAFGPVTERDIVWWTGFSKSQVKKTLIKRETELAKIEIAGLGSQYYLFASQLESLESTRISRQKPVNLLPNLDPYLMGYKDRERHLDPEVFNFIYDRSGNATSAILCGGKIIGVWDIDQFRLKYYLFSKAKEDARNQIRSQADRLGRFFTGKETTISECQKMLPLTERTAGGFMSPLKTYK
jgi:hypothetical protein